MTGQLHWHRCRECGGLGRIDDEQKRGEVSIECAYNCGAHYVLEPEEPVTGEVTGVAT